MFLNRIKQNLAGFAVAAIAFTGLAAVAPAHATGTTVTAAQVGSTSADRGTVAVASNVATVTTTVAANERFSSAYATLILANQAHQLTIQSGDSLRITAAYTNVTQNTTGTWGSLGNVNSNGTCNTVYGWTNAYASALASAGQATQDLALTTGSNPLSAGACTALTLTASMSFTDSSIATGDQLRVTFTVSLVRASTPSAIAIQSAGGTAFYMSSTTTDRSAVIASDATYVRYYSSFCVFRGENGVTPGTQIDVTLGETGNAGTISSVYASTYIQGGAPANPAVSNNSFSFTMPAGNAYDMVTVNANMVINAPTASATFTPTMTAVIHGTNTNVIDLCRRLTVAPAVTATANGNSVTLNWTTPANPSAYATGWDNLWIQGCTADYTGTCGDLSFMINPPAPGSVAPMTGANMSWMGTPLAGSVTTATIDTTNFRKMAVGSVMWNATDSYRFFVRFSSSTGPWTAVSTVTAAISGGGSAPSNVQNVAPTTPTMPTTVPIVAPIAAPVAGVVAGGSLNLGGHNMATVTGVKIDANAATTVATVNGLEVKIPANLAPGKHDLLITTTTGSTLFVGAIKVADPLLVAAQAATAKAAASIAYRAPVDLTVAKAVTALQAAATKALAAQYRGAKTAVCVAIPARKATTAAATTAAAKVCATIKSAIPGIKTVVVVGAPSGDKTNRVSAEIQG